MRYIFLDRDGVINEDTGYVYRKEEYRILPRVVEAMKLLNDNGYGIIVISNQAGIGRGLYTEAQMHSLHNHLEEILRKANVRIERFYFCPHHPEKGITEEYRRDCSCRKPEPGMILEAQKDFHIQDFSNCFFIGDKDSDIEAGKKAGCKTILVNGRYETGSVKPDFTAENLYNAVTRIVL